MEDTNTNQTEASLPQSEDNKKDRNLLPVMCLQIFLIGVLFFLGPWVFFALAVENTSFDEPLFYIVLSIGIIALFVALIVIFFRATPKRSNMRRGFLTFVIAICSFVVGYVVVIYLIVYILATLFHGVRWL